MKITLILALLTIVCNGKVLAVTWPARIDSVMDLMRNITHFGPQVVVVQLGAKFKYSCPVLDGNASDFYWQENNSEFVPRKGYSLTQHPPRFRTLTIDRLQASDDLTIFWCSSVNQAGEISHGFIRLLVLAQDELPRGFPMIDSGKRDSRFRYADSGDVIRLPCHAYGDPMPNTTWFKDSIPIDRNDERYSNVTSNDLFIRNGQPGDSGLYECLAYSFVPHFRTNFQSISKPYKLYVLEEGMVAVSREVYISIWFAVITVISLLFAVIGILVWRLAKSRRNDRVLPFVVIRQHRR